MDRTVILGAGAAGLAAAWELIDRGAKNVTILERAPLVGGLLSYYEKNNNKYEYVLLFSQTIFCSNFPKAHAILLLPHVSVLPIVEK